MFRDGVFNNLAILSDGIELLQPAGATFVQDVGIVNGNALVYIGTAAQTSGNNVVITGNVFGGSDLCGNTLGDITVHIYHTGHDANNEAPNQSEPNPDVAAILAAEQETYDFLGKKYSI